MPFADYEDFDDCVSKNQDKEDPQGYCAEIQRKAEGMHIALLAPEGTWTSDRRFIEPGVLTWRDPAALLFTDEAYQHNGEFVGNLSQFRRVDIDGVPWLVANVRWDDVDQNPIAAEAKRLADEGRMAWLSLDIGDVESVVEVIDLEAGMVQERIVAGEVTGAHQLPISAFADARLVTPEEFARMNAIAAADQCPICYSKPELDQLTPLTVTECGDHHRVMGHIAKANDCHLTLLASRGICVTPPPVEGAVIPLAVTNGLSHPPDRWGWEEAKKWYADQPLAAMVAAWDSELGPVISGTVETDDLDKLATADVSGDWRWDGDDLKPLAVSVLATGVKPAYPVRALVASDELRGFQAGWERPRPDPLAEIAQRLERLENARRVERLQRSLQAV